MGADPFTAELAGSEGTLLLEGLVFKDEDSVELPGEFSPAQAAREHSANRQSKKAVIFFIRDPSLLVSFRRVNLAARTAAPGCKFSIAEKSQVVKCLFC